MARHGGYWGRYPPKSTPRVAADGIRAKSRSGDIGASWWSRRFVAVLESYGIGARLTRGKSYARSGQVLELDIAPGVVTARVQGSRPKPYEVRIALAPLSAGEWERLDAALAGEALYLAALLAGEMPHEIEQVFAAAKLSLFPPGRNALTTSCSCPDWSNPCKHLAAAYYILAERFDEDPFLILAWRGRGREELLRSLRGRESEPDVEAVEPLEARLADFWSAGPGIEGLRFDLAPDAPADVLLSRRGPLAYGGVDVAGTLRPLYAHIRKRAAGWG